MIYALLLKVAPKTKGRNKNGFEYERKVNYSQTNKMLSMPKHAVLVFILGVGFYIGYDSKIAI